MPVQDPQLTTLDYTDSQPYVAGGDAILSESITYVAETRTLLWVDIYRAEVHKLEDVDDLGTHEVFTARGAGSVGAVFPVYRPPAAEGNRSSSSSSSSNCIHEFLFAAKEGLARGSFRTGQWEYVALYEQSGLDAARLARLRSNDGAVHGEYVYVGLIDDFDQPAATEDGCVVRVSLRTYDVELVWPRIRIPNGIHWTKDGAMLLTDSLEGCLWRVPGAPDTHTHPAAERFIDVRPHCCAEPPPEPDGSCTDESKQLLFVAVWAAAKVQLYSLADGSFVRDVLLPPATPRVSSCVLVGPDLFVTTGSEWLGTTTPERRARGGCIYRLRGVLEGASEFSAGKLVRFPPTAGK